MCIHQAKDPTKCKRCKKKKTKYVSKPTQPKKKQPKRRYPQTERRRFDLNPTSRKHETTIAMLILNCTCQFKTHALEYDEKTEAYLKDLIARNGLHRKVTVEGGKSYKVPVAFMLAHTMLAENMDTYGFDEWEDPKPDIDMTNGKAVQ